ncbi:MAG TPA: cupredoxin family copper-binding protein [Hyphomonadaceae bacterium]|nr:cupredoxin family copper-binding protein [Hyphomonadaceae bacterium]
MTLFATLGAAFVFAACSNPQSNAQSQPMADMAMAMPQKAQPTSMAAPTPSGMAAKVSIDNFTFNKANILVPVGATVTWTNTDDVPHTVVSIDHKTFHSKALDTDQSFSFTFTQAGEYPYFCSLHPQMTGKVIVQ